MLRLAYDQNDFCLLVNFFILSNFFAYFLKTVYLYISIYLQYKKILDLLSEKRRNEVCQRKTIIIF